MKERLIENVTKRKNGNWKRGTRKNCNDYKKWKQNKRNNGNGDYRKKQSKDIIIIDLDEYDSKNENSVSKKSSSNAQIIDDNKTKENINILNFQDVNNETNNGKNRSKILENNSSNDISNINELKSKNFNVQALNQNRKQLNVINRNFKKKEKEHTNGNGCSKRQEELNNFEVSENLYDCCFDQLILSNSGINLVLKLNEAFLKLCNNIIANKYKNPIIENNSEKKKTDSYIKIEFNEIFKNIILNEKKILNSKLKEDSANFNNNENSLKKKIKK
jgi:hypothetical protein